MLIQPNAIIQDESALLVVDTLVRSPFALEFERSELKHNASAFEQLAAGADEVPSQEQQFQQSALRGLRLQCNEGATECFLFKCSSAALGSTSPLALGSYHLHWRRNVASSDKNLTPLPFVCSDVTLPAVSVFALPVSVSLDLPPAVTIRSPFTATYTFMNRLSVVQEFEVTFESATNFMFAGLNTFQYFIHT